MAATMSAGVGLKPEHFDDALEATDEGLWFEVHPENCMVAGGPRLAWLDAIATRHPLSLHGVGMSLAADAPPDPSHLLKLRLLVSRLRPALVSEHLAWSAWRGDYHPDLLPFPRTQASLARIADNVSRLQDALGRSIAIENPSHYLELEHTMPEVDFLADLARRTGCGLLVDVNNVFVSARNLGSSAEQYLDRIPGQHVVEIHVAGHRQDEGGSALLVDSHDAPVAEAVWALCSRLVRRIGARPILVERDGNLPSFDILMAERTRAHALLAPAVEVFA